MSEWFSCFQKNLLRFFHFWCPVGGGFRHKSVYYIFNLVRCTINTINFVCYHNPVTIYSPPKSYQPTPADYGDPVEVHYFRCVIHAYLFGKWWDCRQRQIKVPIDLTVQIG